MRSLLRKIPYVLLLFIGLNVFGQTDKLSIQIRADPDWQIIYNNNTEFLNRLLRLPYTLSEIWARGQEYFLQQLNYSRDEYFQRREETRQAAARLLNRFPLLNTPGNCNTCMQSDLQLTSKVDLFINDMRRKNIPDAGVALRQIDSEGGSGPGCGWRFYACVIVCAGTIEIFPVYLACCSICLCEYCRNAPAWCN